MKQSKKITIFSLVVASVMFLNLFLAPIVMATSMDKNGITETVEAFQIKTTEKNQEGFYIETGFKIVNSITTITDSGVRIKTKQEVVEDYYDNSGVFLKSLVNKVIYENDYLTGKARESISIEEFTIPLTIEGEKSELNSLMNENKVKENVRKFTNQIENEYTNVQGMTMEDLQAIRKQIEEVKNNYEVAIDPDAPLGQRVIIQSCATHACAGAFDNYYNYFYTSGDFYIQALSAVGHRYHGLSGNTLGSNLNTRSLIEFMGYINNYEQAILFDMEYDNYALIFDWLAVIVGLVTFAVGVMTGPAGWAWYAMHSAAALATFHSLTNAVYATVQRLQFSQIAMEELENAREMIFTWGNKFENVSYHANIPGY